MKTKFILNFAVFAMALNSYSQIKVFSGGSVTIGAITSPTANSVNHQIIGARTTFPATTAGLSSAALIIGQNSNSTAPAYTFWADELTGIAHPATNVLGITINNSEKFRFNTSNQILSVNTTSSASTPDYSWNSDANTGMFHPANDVLAFTSNGTEVMRINTQRQILNSNTSHNANAPDFSFNANNTTGMFLISTANLGFSTGATERMRINSSGRVSINTTVDDAWLSINTIDYKAASFSVTLNSDWSTTSCISYVNRANSGNYEVRLNGTTKFYVAGQGWIYSDGNYLGSDKNIKDDIKNIDSAMSRINKINGITYKLKVEKQNPTVYGNAQEYMGVIAQDVEKVAPQVVKTLPDGTKAVCYEMLVGLLVEAMKEQNATISQLQNDVSNCCAKNNQRINTNSNDNGSGKDSELNNGSYIKQNSPNPFSKETTIEYFIAEKNANSSVLVFDMNGKLLRTFKLEGNGKGSVMISANDFQPGMYYYSLVVNNKEIGTRKMILTE
jgi:hypothetical protein